GATAPTATTGPVTSVGPTTATVSGSVNPNGSATSWFVEFGTTTSYGSKTAAVNAGSGTSPTTISATLTRLTPGTSYHYRVVATSSAGTSRGADGLLTTSAAPQASTGAAGSVTPTSATLTGTVNPSGRATTWFFEYGTSTSYGTKTAAKNVGSSGSTSTVSTPVSGLAAGTTYHFRIVASNATGTSAGSDQTFATTGPPAVRTGSSTGTTPTGSTLTGSVDSRGHSTSWYFEYGPTTSYGLRTAPRSPSPSGRAPTAS